LKGKDGLEGGLLLHTQTLSCLWGGKDEYIEV
jgi:hypothetical protein